MYSQLFMTLEVYVYQIIGDIVPPPKKQPNKQKKKHDNFISHSSLLLKYFSLQMNGISSFQWIVLNTPIF